MNCANHPDRERVSFCQNCGKPLCAECVRGVGTAAFCEPCLAARLAAANAASPNFAAVPLPGVPPPPGAPNPVLAAALGFIPGVGAMYNGQYAKAVVHLIVFAVLCSIAADSTGAISVFIGFCIPGWIFYQVFDAYHTARARHDGTPLPNPFGLNDIGERFGIGKAWPSAAPVAAPMAAPAAAYAPPPGPQFVQTADGSQTFAGGDGSHFHQGADGTQSFRAADGTFFHQEPRGGPAAGTQTYAGTAWRAPGEAYAPIPPIPGAYAGAYPTPYADPQFGRSRFPAGAIWLIVLGLLFFFGSSGLLRHFPIQRVIPFVLIGFGVWLFVRKMTGSGQALTDDGNPAYRLRLFSALRGSVWVVLVGVLFFLDTFDILDWGRSWPLFIIVAGLMAFVERSAMNTAAAMPFAYAPAPQAAAPDTGAAKATATTSVVPYTARESTRDLTRDTEGS